MSEIKIGRMILGPIGTNCYFVFRDDIKEAVFFDPADQGAEIYNALKDRGIKVAAIALTHGHYDHIGGVAKLRQLSHCKIYAGRNEEKLLGDPEINCSCYQSVEVTVTPDVLLKDNDILEIGGMSIKVIETPGHTAGGVCYYIEEAGILISGDTLFEQSVGRTDMPTGDMLTQLDSINSKLMCLPEDTKVYPGHGGSTTIGDEKRLNPFL